MNLDPFNELGTVFGHSAAQVTLGAPPSVEKQAGEEHPKVIVQPQILTACQVALVLNISVRSVHRLVAVGELPRPVKIGRSSRFPASEVQDYLERIKRSRGTTTAIGDTK